jgi:phytoene dehydrogenase-like protein
MTPKQRRFVAEYLVDLNATQAALRAGYSPRTAPPQGSRLLKNVDVQAAIATQQAQQLEAVEVRIEDVLRDLKAIAHTDPHVLSEQSGVPARWADKLKALELLMKHLGLAAPEQHQHLHQHVHFTPEQLKRMTDEQLDRTETAYATLVALEQEVAADEAQARTLQCAGRRQHLWGRRAPA